jgi:hypothetical protein
MMNLKTALEGNVTIKLMLNKVLSRDKVTIDGVWFHNRIYWTL